LSRTRRRYHRLVVLILVLLFVVAPLVELAVFVQVAQWIGLLQAIGLMLAVSIGGVLVVRYEGLGVIRRVRNQLREGRLPAADLVDGLLILIAGILLILPGFISDIVAVLLLLPPTRVLVRRMLQKHWTVRIASGVATVAGPPLRRVRNDSDVIDVPGTDPPSSQQPPSPPELPQ
jgi:UPF0716 protein FxsA